MLEILPSSESVLAIIVSNKITSEDLDTIMDRLDAIMTTYDKVHIYVETRGIDGIELSGLGRYTARALPLLGKLHHFGRVAVVSDQAWIRLGTRIESAVLPFISYRTFEPEEAKDAMAWVEGGDEAKAKAG